MAGESAGDVARRQREKAERLLHSAEMWERGQRGEQATGAVLDDLRQRGWAVFHDVRWPGRPRANIDHVLVGPPGVYVVDSKNWSGRITVSDNAFRCNGRRQDRTVAAAGDAALAVAGLVSAPAAATTRSVLCFVRDEPVAGWCHDVMVCSTGNLREMLLTRPPTLTPEQVRLAAIELDIAFRAAAPSAGRTPMARPQLLPRPPAPKRSRARRKKSSTGQLVRLGLVVVAGMLLISQIPRLADLGDIIGDGVAKSLAPTGASYDSCAELREDFPRGVGTPAAVRRLKLEGPKPRVAPDAYRANATLDTDGDGLACERHRHAARS